MKQGYYQELNKNAQNIFHPHAHKQKKENSKKRQRKEQKTEKRKVKEKRKQFFTDVMILWIAVVEEKEETILGSSV